MQVGFERTRSVEGVGNIVMVRSGPGNVELSGLNKFGVVDRYVPLGLTSREAQASVDVLRSQMSKFELDLINKINAARNANGLGLLTRIAVLNPAAGLGAEDNAKHPSDPLTHNIDRDTMLVMPLEELARCGASRTVTEPDLDAVGVKVGFSASPTSRSNLSSLMSGLASSNWYGARGGVTEVAARWKPEVLDAEEVQKVFDALWASPAHRAAMLTASAIHSGVAGVINDSDGTTAVHVVIGSGLNGTNWPISTEGWQQIFLPLILR